MRPINCLRIAGLVDKRAAGLTESERLRLEEHLASCQSCSAEARTLSALRELVLQAPHGISVPARRRVIRRAMEQGPRRGQTSARRSVHWAAGTAGLAVAAAAVWFLALGPAQERRSLDLAVAPSKQPAAASTQSRVLSGSVKAGGGVLPQGQPVPGDVDLQSPNGATLSLGHARVELRADTRLRWHAQRSTVKLLAGSVHVEVDPKAARRFQVATARFVVLVIGTRFEVTPESVAVVRGKVRILAPDQSLLVEALAAGQTWTPTATVASGVVIGAEGRAGDAEQAKATEPGGEDSAPAAREAKHKGDRRLPPSASALLAKARRLLAAAKVREARRAIDAAIAQATSRQNRAEAQSLRAECALVQGDYAGAIRFYRAVAQRYPDLAAAENALFAAATLETRRGRPAAARALLNAYLERYPGGRFRKEVVVLQRALGAGGVRRPK